MEDLIKRLCSELGVDRKQARGGLVALLRAGQQQLQPGEFEQFLNGVPGARQLLSSAPAASPLSSIAGGLGTLFGGRSKAGRWAGLAASFSELGIDLNTARQFGPIVIDHVREHGGTNLVDQLRTALKP